MTDGPYTSYDLNTLLKATAGERRAVVIGKGYFFCYPPSILSLVFNKALVLLTLLIIILGDKLVGEVSRLVVAEACIQALDIESTEGQIYEINSVKVFGFFFPVVYNTIGYRRLFSRIDTRIHVIKLVTEITTVFSHELISHSQLVSRQLPNQQLNHSFYHT